MAISKSQINDVRLLLWLTLGMLALHVYDWTLHLEDNFAWSVPWQRPTIVSYTTFWTTYWGVATVLSLVAALLLVKQLRARTVKP